MPWPWSSDDKKKKEPFPAAPNSPVVTPKPVPKGRFDKVISGKNQRNRMDEALKNSGG